MLRFIPVMLVGGLSGLGFAQSPQRAVPRVDSSLAALLAPALFDSLRGAGTRDDVSWVAGDSSTFTALSPVAILRHIHLAPPRDSLLPCPAASHTAAAARPSPAGYHVFLRAVIDTAGVLCVQVMVRCQDFYQGRSRGFAEGLTWEAVHDATGWHVGRLRDHFIT